MTALQRLRRQRRGLLRAAASIVVSAVLLYLVLRAVPLGDLLDTLSEVPPVLPLLAAVAAFGFVLARAWRFRLLLGIPRSQTGTLLAVTLSSWGASLILPGPSGDAAFAWLARTRLQKPVAVGLGAALLSRLLDVVSLVLIALVTAPLAGVGLPRVFLFGGLLVALVIAAGLTALFYERTRRIIVRWLEGLPLRPGLHERLHAAVEELGSGSRPALLVIATLAARVATGLQYFALFAAIEPLSLVQVWFALSVRTLLFAVPIQGLGGLGTTQVWWTAGLTLLGWSAPAALAASLAVHLLDLLISLPQAALGWAVLQFRRPAPDDALPAEAEAQRV
jgi:glycosyltransferase 2 family protein